VGATATAFAGIDVSKDRLDACLLLPGGKAKDAAFGDDPTGHAALLAWADRHAKGAAVHPGLEATGPYSEAPATALADAGRLVSVVNPTRVKDAGLARGRGNTTDRADARLIADYAAREKPPVWQPPPPEVRQPQALVRRLDDLRETAARERGRLASPTLTGAARRSVERTVRLLEREATKVRDAADALVAAAPALEADRALLESSPGVGRRTAVAVLAELPPVGRLPSAGSAAYCGLAPSEFKSGAGVQKRTRLSKAGNARLRQGLFLPTQAAVRFNPVLRRFFARMVAAGKPKMQAIGAWMRRLVMIGYGVLKNRAPFDPEWASKNTR
jgi:transposase